METVKPGVSRPINTLQPHRIRGKKRGAAPPAQEYFLLLKNKSDSDSLENKSKLSQMYIYNTVDESNIRRTIM